MTAAQAIEHLRQDLERYAASGKASPKAIAFKKEVLNTLIDALNTAEDRERHVRAQLEARVSALENDLKHRDTVIAGLHGRNMIDMQWSYLEGRLQSALAYRHRHVDAEEGKSMSPEAAKRERAFLRLVGREMNMLYDAAMAALMANGRLNLRYNALLGWSMMHGADLITWLSIPEEWHKHLWVDERSVRVLPHGTIEHDALPIAVALMRDRELIDGISNEHGMATGSAYRNRPNVCYNVLSSVADEERHEQLLQENPGYARACAQVWPHREPAWCWDSTHDERATQHQPTTTPF